MPGDTRDVVVIGAGVIGLSIAYRLATAGRSVTILDAGRTGRASIAAAGMLAPLAESNSLPALAEIGIPSLRRYPDFLAELADATSLKVKLNGPGILRVAMSDDEAASLCASIGRQSASGFPVYLLSWQETRDLEQSLSHEARLSVLSPAEKHVVPTELLEALRFACKNTGVDFRREEVLSLRQSSAGWTVSTTGASSSPETIHCGEIVVAAGAWTRKLLAPLGVELPISPLKGQVIGVRTDDGLHSPPFTQTVYAHSTYLVPRPSGQILIGATEEPDAGFDAAPTQDAADLLLDNAARLVPNLSNARLENAWAGLRPLSPDRLPMIGKLPGYANAYVASGHGRNGILLAPITADLTAALILNGAPPPASVDPARFVE